ncbi:MAG: Mpo1-like protein [Hyphomicrobiaceae bacterium]
MTPDFESFEEFWPHYLRQHADPVTRKLHFVGTTCALWMMMAAAWMGSLPLLVAAPIVAYAFAWAGHASIEHNRPATFSFPLWSLRGDIRMYRYWLDGRLGGELRRAGLA